VSLALHHDKSGLRLRLLEEVKRLSGPEKKLASEGICARLAAQLCWERAKAVLFFAPTFQEPDVGLLAAKARLEGKQIAYPRFHPSESRYEAARVADPDRDLVPGRFGIAEPNGDCAALTLNQLDLILVPGVGFSPNGARLGRGGGYYDRLLAQVRNIKCGVAFDCQVVVEVPQEAHDIRMDYLLTPTRWVEFRRFGVQE
jgi:5-formyltetrahydrofolate cyclo-ligase